MKINFQNLEQYAKLLEFNTSVGHKMYENVYLDTTNGYVYFPRMNMVGRIPIEVTEVADESEHQAFFVNATKLLSLIKESTELYLNEDKVFSPSDTFRNKYLLENLVDEYDPPEFELEGDDWTVLTIQEDSEFLQHLNNSFMFITQKFPAHYGMFIRGERLIATNKRQLYEGVLPDSSIKVEGDNTDIDFSFNTMKIIQMCFLSGEEKVEVSTRTTDDVQETFISTDTLMVRLSSEYDLSIPDTTDENFVAAYDHENYILVDRGLFEQQLNRITPFLSKNKNSRFFLRVTEEDDTTLLTFNSIDENKVTEVIQIDDGSSEVDELLDKDFWFDATYLKNTIKALGTMSEGDMLKIQLDPETVTSNFSMPDVEGFHVVQVILEDS